ncbi:bifunctional D-glycero-beta-D-manno-heptose-7-phosphate kinase/D-glycero-beta-D-manno-heptose 1-phosphate adenylyltransferase HldE [Candidatus Erwinia haradaeae]|uniref:Bifunctional protein HldE n=1 Tax=Candidatus Erwinia haradaeae TaxID=1922217 RepID=A0A803GCF6_9GAMM|nr:bifunctional D-glycero-beta-D-manno-heptose-7-phosphate kinase/D-glycero-beta-D-manno-heptose 1-phosphate adenylyltransferase HldE [Candidatus Erwinia haradaeae]VFP87940.1 Bifunctional protein HldE [Candidatus Erwinia haradaeae]
MNVTLPSFTGVGVLIVGDVLLDQYWYGRTPETSSEAPVLVVKVNHIEDRPGGAANVAMNIVALGAQSYLIGFIGDDAAAKSLRTALDSVNVIYDFISVDNYSTIIKTRVLARNQQLIRLDFEEKLEGVYSELIHDRIYKFLPNIGAIVLSDYDKGALANVQTIISLARNSGVAILVDPKGNDFSRYYGATLLTPNLYEFEKAVGKCKNEDDILQKGTKLMQENALSGLLITRSENGMLLLQPDQDPFYMPTQAKEVYDVTGAGDTVIGVVATAIAAGCTLEEGCFLANIAAGVVVGKIGTSTVSSVELNRAIQMRFKEDGRMINEVKLIIEVRKARQRGETIVMTNGVFDILHAGHVSFLSNARQLGDRLIVAVNSDLSTCRLKGMTRPVNSLINRMRVLSALEAIDWVISFDNDTPQKLISKILPDVLVKGGDYKSKMEEIAGSKEVLDNGGTVRVLNFEDGITTSQIIQTIIRRKGNN